MPTERHAAPPRDRLLRCAIEVTSLCAVYAAMAPAARAQTAPAKDGPEKIRVTGQGKPHGLDKLPGRFRTRRNRST